MTRDFQETQPIGADGTAVISTIVSDQEVYEIERLAARITLLGYVPGQRMSMRRAIEDSVLFMSERVKRNEKMALEQLGAFSRVADEEPKKQTLFRVSPVTKTELREITKKMGYGATDTNTLLAAVALRQAALEKTVDRLASKDEVGSKLRP